LMIKQVVHPRALGFTPVPALGQVLV
jgi:hypothetical protein